MKYFTIVRSSIVVVVVVVVVIVVVAVVVDLWFDLWFYDLWFMIHGIDRYDSNNINS